MIQEGQNGMIWGIPIADFIQIIIGGLSLIATIFVSLAIYWMQRHHEKEREEYEKKAQEKSVRDTAKMFIIDNEVELDFLPLCQIASMLYPNHRHMRNIYTRFNMCNSELQKEILKQTNTASVSNISFSTIGEFVEKYRNDVKRCGLGTSEFLYDGAKYFHRGFQYYSQYPINDINPSCFETPLLTSIQKSFNTKHDLTLYMDEYLYVLEQDDENGKNEPAPIDVVWNSIANSRQESDVTFWVMRMIISGCIAMLAHNIIPNNDEWRGIPFDEYRIQSQEDMYYYTILVLMSAYGHTAKDKEDK